MMVHVCEKKWSCGGVIVESLRGLFKNYHATIDLKGGSGKVELERAIENVLTNYSVCLRDRSSGDVRAIMKIADTVLVDFKYDRVRVEGMVGVIDIFSKYLDLHKKGENLMNYCIEVDEYGHYVRYKGGVEGLVANILWRDVEGIYKGYKLQLAIDNALSKNKFANELRSAFVGEEFDDGVLELKLPEPIGSHFKEITLEMENKEMFSKLGMSDSQCIHCGQKFYDTWVLLDHLQKELGVHFYNGHRAVRKAIDELGVMRDEVELFKKTKELLFKKYGVRAGFLHTKRCKDRLLYFINKYKQVGFQGKQVNYNHN